MTYECFKAAVLHSTIQHEQIKRTKHAASRQLGAVLQQQCQISLFVILQIRKQPRRITKRRTTTKRDKVQNEYRDKKQFKQFFPTIVQYLQNTCYFIHCASWTLWNSAVQLRGVRKASSPAIIFTTLAPSSDEMKTNFQASGWMLTESLSVLVSSSSSGWSCCKSPCPGVHSLLSPCRCFNFLLIGWIWQADVL